MSWAAAVKKAPTKAAEEAPKAVRYYIDSTEIVRDGHRTLLEQDMTDAILRVREEASKSLVHLLDTVRPGILLDLLKCYYEIGSLMETHRTWVKDPDAESKDEVTEEDVVTEESEVDDDFEY
jgi:hypothetical protein